VSDPQETYLNPPGAIDAASRLTRIGSDFASRWGALHATIAGLNADTPWGTDEPGRTFAEHYTGGDEPVEAKLRTALTELALALSEVGPAITASATGTVADDESTGRSMRG
jgi:hypothetical protein